MAFKNVARWQGFKGLCSMNSCLIAVAPFLARNPYHFSYFLKGGSSFRLFLSFFSSSLSSRTQFSRINKFNSP